MLKYVLPLQSSIVIHSNFNWVISSEGLMLVHLQPIPYAENLPFYQW